MTRSWITSVVRTVDRALISIAAIGLVAMMVHISLDILSSLIFNAPISVTSAIVTNYYMIAVAFLPILAAEYRGNHISVNLLTVLLPEGVRLKLETLVIAITAGVYLLLTAQSWQQALHKLSINASVVEQVGKIPVWPSFFFLPLAFGTMALLLIARVVLRLTGQNDIHATDTAELETDHV